MSPEDFDRRRAAFRANCKHIAQSVRICVEEFRGEFLDLDHEIPRTAFMAFGVALCCAEMISAELADTREQNAAQVEKASAAVDAVLEARSPRGKIHRQ